MSRTYQWTPLGSDHWVYKRRLGRVSCRLDVFRHHYANSHRWVIQPTIQWDVY